MRERMTLQETANYVIGSAEITNRTGLRSATIFSFFKGLSYRKILPNKNTLILVQSTQYDRVYLNHTHPTDCVPENRGNSLFRNADLHSIASSDKSTASPKASFPAGAI